MSKERKCFSRRELRMSLRSRTNRRSNTKRKTMRPKDETSTLPKTRLGRKIMKIRQTCDCDVHKEMRGET